MWLTKTSGRRLGKLQPPHPRRLPTRNPQNVSRRYADPITLLFVLSSLTLGLDRLARQSGKEPTRIPVVHSNPLETSALPTPDSYTFFSAWESKSTWKNDVTVKSVEMLRANDPSAHIHRIAPTPLLMTVAESDVLTPTDLALEAYNRAREPKQLQILPGAGHFDAYTGPYFEKNAGTQTEFLKRTLCSKWSADVAAK